MIGIGTYKLDADTTYRIVKRGLEIGYRLIDTAQLYKNEEAVGKAIRDSGINRDEITIVTKVWLTNIEQGRNAIIQSILTSLTALNINYVDVLLLHGPVRHMITESWRTMEDIHIGIIPELNNMVKSIGVSNYGLHDLKTVLANCRIKPVCNQIELSPFCRRDELVKFCRSNDITIIAHSSLTKAKMFDHPLIIQLCSHYKCNPSKILLNWGLAKGYIILPRTSNELHLKENLDPIILLTTTDILQLDTITDTFCSHNQYVDL